MNFELFTIVDLKGKKDIYKPFIRKYHYSKTVARGSKFIFGLYNGTELRGICQVGYPVGQRVQQKYGQNTGEIKRFCLGPNAVKNEASWFLSRCIKLVRFSNTYARLISYADQNKNHKGTIYKAANFTYLGQSKPQQYAVINKKKHHLRTLYQKINGKPTKTAILYKRLYKKGLTKLKWSKPKHIFMYNFN